MIYKYYDEVLEILTKSTTPLTCVEIANKLNVPTYEISRTLSYLNIYNKIDKFVKGRVPYFVCLTEGKIMTPREDKAEKSYVYLMDLHNTYFKFGETTNYRNRIKEVRKEGCSVKSDFINKTNATYLKVLEFDNFDKTIRRILEDFIRVSFYNTKKTKMCHRDYFVSKCTPQTIEKIFFEAVNDFCELHEIKYKILEETA